MSGQKPERPAPPATTQGNLYLAATYGTRLVQKYIPVSDMTTTNAKGQPL